ncbi:hypothetical protein HYW21_05340 [Candidatus Woesearchaeota archaeon]|nr:hypothetical protein [Candidatus Woesearchaeota archaeon]
MKGYITRAVKEVQQGDKLSVTIPLKKRKDYKKNSLSVLYNKVLFTIQKKMVPSPVKNALLRTTGMKIGYDACIPHDITFDPYFPELIELQEGCILGGGSTVITHTVANNALTLGKVILTPRTLVGGMTTLKHGAVIKKNAILMFHSELQAVVPEGEVWGGKPASKVKALSAEEMEKYFKPSDGNAKAYYKTAKQKLAEFQKNPSQGYFKLQYNGNRLNAGNDWWRGRNVVRIYVNGIIVEFCRLLPACWLKNALYRLMGAKIGKNVHIAKGVVLDHIYGDLTTIEDDVQIDEDVYIDGHEYTISQTIFGRNHIKKGAHLGHHSFVRCGTTIGENTIIEPYSIAQREIPANEVWGGNPAVFIRKVNSSF